MQTGRDYMNASYQNPPYTRMETIILTAFELSPAMNLPQLHSDKKETFMNCAVMKVQQKIIT